MDIEEKEGKVEKTENKSFYKEESINSFNEYVDCAFFSSTSGYSNLFRGQPDDFKLFPKIAREQHFYSENYNVIEKKILEDFKLKSRPYLDFKPNNEWEWISIAQHHGLKTRLLDWTENPLAALWFCVKDEKNNKSGYGVVWKYKYLDYIDFIDIEKDKSPFQIESTKILQPPFISNRIIAQSALFTVHPIEDKEPSCVAFENDVKSFMLTKIKIPQKLFFIFKDLLRQFGIHVGSLFPDLDGLCNSLNEMIIKKETSKMIMDTILEYGPKVMKELERLKITRENKK